MPHPPEFSPEELDKSINKAIESGEYYKDALDWYFHRFLLPISQRSIMTFIASVTVIALFPVAASFNSLFPLSDAVPFIIWSKYTDEKYPELRRLGEDLTRAEEMFARYFLINYVKDREEYYPNSKQLNRERRSRVRSQSSRRVNREYDTLISPKNKQSFINRFSSHTGRTVTNLKVTFPENQAKLQHAFIRFDTEEKRVNHNTPATVTHWEAEVLFRLTDIDLILSRKKELRLLVQSYKVRQVFY